MRLTDKKTFAAGLETPMPGRGIGSFVNRVNRGQRPNCSMDELLLEGVGTRVFIVIKRKIQKK